MSQLRAAQQRHDDAEPEDNSAYEAAADRWIEDKAENLVRGCDLIIRRRNSPPVTVEYNTFLTAVQDHLNQRQIDGEDNEDMFAQLVIAADRGAPAKSLARNVLGHSDHPRGKLYELAIELVSPHAEAGLEAQAEDDDL